MHVLRLCSVFEPPRSALSGRGVRFDPIGGMQNHTACLTRALDARGVTQDVVTTRPPGAPVVEHVGTGATVHRLGLPVRILRQCYAVPAARLVHRLAAHADVVHAHCGEDLAVVPIAATAARRHGVPLVLTVHLSLGHTLDRPGARTAVLRHLGARIERLGTDLADAVIVLTPRSARVMLDAGVDAERLHVIPSGVEQRLFDGADDGDALAGVPHPRVVFVGRLAQQKGVTHLVDAAARLRTPGVSVTLVGDGPDRAALERQAAGLGVADRVRFLGFRAHDEVPAVLAATDVLVLPSVYEELGSVLLEGLQAGVPIVASDTGGIPDALGDAGVLVPPRDPDALADALDALLADPARRLRLSALARERAAGYDWNVLGERVLGVYRAAAGLDAVPRLDEPVEAVIAPPA